jgi:acrylyl-CoA reductase (NADPH)
LRGVSLLGIDSALRSRSERMLAWRRLVALSDSSWFRDVAHDITLDDAIPQSYELLAGNIRGRVVVALPA